MPPLSTGMPPNENTNMPLIYKLTIDISMNNWSIKRYKKAVPNPGRPRKGLVKSANRQIATYFFI